MSDKLVKAIHKAAEAHATRAQTEFVATVVGLNPLSVELHGAADVIDEDDGLALTQWVKFYDRTGLKLKDTVLVSCRGDSWFVTDVVADTEIDLVRAPMDNSVTSATIVDGAIVNADVSGSAGIQPTKIMGGRMIGEIVASAAFAIPALWLRCSGQAVSRAVYAVLFATIAPLLGTVTITNASPGVVARTAHGLSVDDAVYFTTTGTLPTGLTANTLYYVSVVPDVDHIQVATTRGGASINTSSAGSGVHSLTWCPYGLGDGSTTFNVPDYKGRTIIGVGTAGAGVVGGVTPTGATKHTMGQPGGEETHKLLSAESGIVSHTHTLSGSTSTGTTGTGTTGTGTTGTEAAHVHSANGGGNFISTTGNVGASIVASGTAWNQATVTGAGSAHSHSVPGLSVPALSVPALGVGSLAAGAVAAADAVNNHNTLSPYSVAQVLIYAGA